MEKVGKVQLNVLVPREHHDLLVRMSARKNLADPRANSTKGGLAAIILCESLSKMLEEESSAG